MPASQLHSIDYVVLAVYLAATVALGLAIGRRMRTGKDFFLAGRSLPWWGIGVSLVATDIGATDIIGVGGAAYRHGLAVANFEWIGCIPAMILGAFIFIPYFWRLGIYTIPEFMERRYNVAVRGALASCWLLFMACNVGIMLFASAKMVGTLFGWDPTWCILAMALLVGVYTCAGGLAAVVYTDVIQGIVMVGGCLLVLVLGLIELGGLDELHDALRRGEAALAGAAGSETAAAGRSEHSRLILPADTTSPFPWPGIFFGLAFVLSPAYWLGNQAIVQRSLGARSEFDARAAYVWGALLKNLIPLAIAVPGLIAFARNPALADGDQALPVLVAELLPAGLRGLFLAAFAAALMSSVDSYLNSASTILTSDLYKRFLRPRATETHLLAVGRAATAGLVVWAVLFALYLSRLEGTGIYTVFQTLMAFFQGPALALLLAGFFWRRANGAGALAGFLGGVATAIALFALSRPAVAERLGLEPLFRIQEPFLYFSVWSFLVAAALVVAVSLVTRPEPDERIEALLYRRRREGLA